MFKELLKEMEALGVGTVPDKKVTPEELHNWYLQGSKELDPDNFNDEAQVPYEELPEPQRKLDQFIADKVNAKLEGKDVP